MHTEKPLRKEDVYCFLLAYAELCWVNVASLHVFSTTISKTLMTAPPEEDKPWFLLMMHLSVRQAARRQYHDVVVAEFAFKYSCATP